MAKLFLTKVKKTVIQNVVIGGDVLNFFARFNVATSLRSLLTTQTNVLLGLRPSFAPFVATARQVLGPLITTTNNGTSLPATSTGLATASLLDTSGSTLENPAPNIESVRIQVSRNLNANSVRLNNGWTNPTNALGPEDGSDATTVGSATASVLNRLNVGFVAPVNKDSLALHEVRLRTEVGWNLTAVGAPELTVSAGGPSGISTEILRTSQITPLPTRIAFNKPLNSHSWACLETGFEARAAFSSNAGGVNNNMAVDYFNVTAIGYAAKTWDRFSKAGPTVVSDSGAEWTTHYGGGLTNTGTRLSGLGTFAAPPDTTNPVETLLSIEHDEPPTECSVYACWITVRNDDTVGVAFAVQPNGDTPLLIRYDHTRDRYVAERRMDGQVTELNSHTPSGEPGTQGFDGYLRVNPTGSVSLFAKGRATNGFGIVNIATYAPMSQDVPLIKSSSRVGIYLKGGANTLSKIQTFHVVPF